MNVISAPPRADGANQHRVRAALSTASLGTASRWLTYRPAIGAVLIVGLLAAALLVLRAELAGTGYDAVMSALATVPRPQVMGALALTLLAYVMLAGYDALALRYIKRRITTPRVLLASSLSYGISQMLGFPLLTGNAVRVRFWTAWGLSTEEMARAAAFVSTTFTIGMMAVSGAALLIEPESSLALLHVVPALARTVGAALLLATGLYVLWSLLRRGRSVRVYGWLFSVPSHGLVVAQLALASVDWVVASLVLFVLLPSGHAIAFVPFVGLFVLAQSVGVLSHIPGGLGVFDTIMILALQPVLSAQEALVALVAYRAIYYLMPFVSAVSTLVVLEMLRHRSRVPIVLARTRATVAQGAQWARVVQPLIPTAIGVTTFVSGVILLFSGVTPAASGRLRALTTVLPLGLVELSHFLGSLVGVGLLILGWALRRRLDAAWGLTVLLLSLGIVVSLLKGLDYEEAIALTAALVVLLPARGAFYRKSALTTEPLSPQWLAAVTAVIGASVWLGLFTYRHVDYSSDMFWDFAARGNAPRFLRATAGAVAAVVLVGASRLLRHATYARDLPTPDELRHAAAIVAATPESVASLVLLGDKSLVYDPSEAAFVMYGVSGRSWIAMGDPIGPTDAAIDAAWRFKLEADAHGAWPVFYQVTAERLPLYIDLGLTMLKLGEEAFVALESFSLAGAERRWMRRSLTEAEKAGLTFDVVPPAAVPALLPTLRAISDEWLGGKSTREKGFSLGCFDDAYLQHFPIAVVRAPRNGGTEIVAFANLWCGAPGGEFSPDLMRRSAHAPRGVMDFLFIQLLLWGKAEGYAKASLGMAPLAGLASPLLARPELAPLWSRAGAFVFGRGEQFYNFQGLRAFKEKFGPVWEPRYLASPGGFALPRVLTNVTTLISGGVAGIVHK